MLLFLSLTSSDYTLSQDTALQNLTTPGEPPDTPTTSPTTFHPTGQHIKTDDFLS